MAEMKRTERGFPIWRIPFFDYIGSTEREFQIQVSSILSDDGPKLWIGPSSAYSDLNGDGEMTLMERAHLGVLEVREIRDALTEWLEAMDPDWAVDENGSIVVGDPDTD